MKLSHVTRGLLDSGGKALVPFFTAGYPDEKTFVQLVLGAARSGCDVIEIGIPFSDPIADGPVIQQSSQIVLEAGMTLERALQLAKDISSETDTPLVAMSYINPILNMGLDRFTTAAAEAGIGGLILPDVSFEESGDIRRRVQGGGIDYIDLVAPTSSEDRVRAIVTAGGTANENGGWGAFVYLVSVTGVTGSGGPLEGDLGAFTERVRQCTQTPLYVGFGVSTADQARLVTRHADGVIFGSRLIRLINETPTGRGQEAVFAVTEFLAEVKRTISGAVPE
jgi:tryptophan synthase alpha chain